MKKDKESINKAKRVKGSGLSTYVKARVKDKQVGSIQTRLDELGLNLSDYLRELIRQDIGVEV